MITAVAKSLKIPEGNLRYSAYLYLAEEHHRRFPTVIFRKQVSTNNFNLDSSSLKNVSLQTFRQMEGRNILVT